MNKAVKIITYPITYPFRYFAGNARRAISAPGRREVWADITDLPRRARAIREGRDIDAPGAPDMRRFDEVLRAWGIAPEEVPRIVRNMQIEVALFAGLGLYGVFLGAQAVSWWDWFLGVVVTCTAGAVIVLRSWRISVLNRRNFSSFGAWFAGR